MIVHLILLSITLIHSIACLPFWVKKEDSDFQVSIFWRISDYILLVFSIITQFLAAKSQLMDPGIIYRDPDLANI